MSGGILDQIGNNESYKKSELTVKKLTDVIKENLFNQPVPDNTPIVLYTGLYGYYIFDLYMMGFGVPVVYYSFSNRFKKSSFIIVLNLYEKSGMYKAIINTRTRTVEIRKGTEIIKSAFKFEDLEKYLQTLGSTRPKEFYTSKGIKKYIK